MKQTKQISLLMNHLRCRLEEQKQPGHYWTTMVPVLTAGWRTQMGMLGGGDLTRPLGNGRTLDVRNFGSNALTLLFKQLFIVLHKYS